MKFMILSITLRGPVPLSCLSVTGRCEKIWQCSWLTEGGSDGAVGRCDEKGARSSPLTHFQCTIRMRRNSGNSVPPPLRFLFNNMSLRIVQLQYCCSIALFYAPYLLICTYGWSAVCKRIGSVAHCTLAASHPPSIR